MVHPSSYSAYISYSTYPNTKRKEYVDSIDKIYEKIHQRRKTILGITDDSYENNYRPIHYHLWGNWSLFSLCFIDDSHLITKNIHPDFVDKSQSDAINRVVLGFVNTKTITGLIFDNIGMSVKDFTVLRNSPNEYPFVASVNFTISKKWLIPNGYLLIHKIINKVNEILSEDKFILINSYSSYELCLTIFGKSLKHLAKKINEIRDLKSKSINCEELDTLQPPMDGKENSNILSDSNTNFGVRYDPKDDKFPSNAHYDVKAQYEIEIRPSKSKIVFDELSKNNLSVSFMPGKCKLA